MKTLASLIIGLSLVLSSHGAENKQSTADHLQNVSVTIRSEGEYSNGEGSGVIFSRKDKDGNLVNLVWTAAHVIDNLRSTREVLVGGAKKTIVEFKDPMVVKEIRQNGRTVGRLQMDAEVLKYSDADDGHDLALLKVRKFMIGKNLMVFIDKLFLRFFSYMDNVCEDTANRWKKNIKEKSFTPLKKSTIDIRKYRKSSGGSKHLFDTGALYKSIEAQKRSV